MNIILRGDTFRGCSVDDQFFAFKNIVRHVIEPLNYKNEHVNVFLVTYNKYYENEIRTIFKNYNFFYFTIIKSTQVNGFINSFNVLLESKVNRNGTIGTLILRSDLCFKQNITYDRISKDKILFQWNLLHNKKTGEIADQIHFVGSGILEDFVDKINSYQIDTRYKGSLHNLYNFCVDKFGRGKISYLNYIQDPEPSNDICKIRGNPGVQLGNPLYNYTRYMSNNTATHE
jgi:hypothetical protein